MSSKHQEASKFVQSRFFEGLISFRDFEARTEKLANTKEVGDAFEILVEAYLYLHPVLKAKNVWLVGGIPMKIRTQLNLPSDTKGIDGIYEDAAGNLIPYQVKYRTDKDTLSYTEVSSFLGITEESLQDRVIFTNARNLANDITKRKGLRSVRASQFYELGQEDFQRIFAWLTGTKAEFKRWDPMPHQKEAIAKITDGLKGADRTTAVMACGTGKTLVALWVAEAQEAKTVLVLVPSLALLSQTLPDWCKQTSWGNRFRYLCVCSDASVNHSFKEDEYLLKQSDLEFPVTTEANQVEAFIAGNKTGVNVIFSTYQSAEVVANGLRGLTIDLGIFDEAHKTTGPKEGLFAFGLSDKNLRIKKRLFLTATPRHYDLRKRDKDGDFRTVSMSDEAVYGKVSYRLSFSAAVAAGIIVPYKVIISVTLNKEVDDELLRRGTTLVRRNQVKAKWVANQIALKRAIEQTKASKVITFHSRVKLAEDFAGDGAQGFSEHCKGFELFHANGGQNAAYRKALLDGFKEAPKGLITNARCLTEGVDVPAVDMVAFVDPRKSRIDIAQAAGRAMRVSRATDKKLGYIVVPLFVEQEKGETEAEALSRSGFDDVAMVLGAMLENDSDLIDVIREAQEERGFGIKFNPRKLNAKIDVIGPAIDLSELTQSIEIKILDHLGLTWDRWFGLLQKFHTENSHSRVPYSFILDDEKLGIWVSAQRQRKLQLTPEQVDRLNSLNFSWDAITDKWEYGFFALQKFKSKYGHCRVSQNFKQDGFKLGTWVSTQRENKSELSIERVFRLDSIDFIWDPLTKKWEEAFAALKEFHAQHGHCLVGVSHKVKKLRLGAWVCNLRQNKDRLSGDRIAQLDSLGFTWDPLAKKWEDAFMVLKQFQALNGHCRVPDGFILNGLHLGAWTARQRSIKNSLGPHKISKLESLGFSWDALNDKWESAFEALKAFHELHGHSNVPQRYAVGGLQLGRWAYRQRKQKSVLGAVEISRLDDLGFNWDPLTSQWNEAFEVLKEFRKQTGHCRIPGGLVVNQLKIGDWVGTQRRTRKILSADKIRLLESVQFCWDPLAEKWEEAFSALIDFRSQTGHCRVGARYVIKGLKLGVWVNTQRRTKSRLSHERIKRLDSVGFSWNP